MEHASFGDQRNATFSLAEEDHTLANALRFTLNQDPRVIFCGYSIPHPSEARVNIRVQTTEHWRGLPWLVEASFSQAFGLAFVSRIYLRPPFVTNGAVGEPAREVLKDSCQDLMLMCQHIRGTFDKAVNDFRTKNPPDNHPSQDMDSD